MLVLYGYMSQMLVDLFNSSKFVGINFAERFLYELRNNVWSVHKFGWKPFLREVSFYWDPEDAVTCFFQQSNFLRTHKY